MVPCKKCGAATHWRDRGRYCDHCGPQSGPRVKMKAEPRLIGARPPSQGAVRIGQRQGMATTLTCQYRSTRFPYFQANELDDAGRHAKGPDEAGALYSFKEAGSDPLLA